jgi:hypothetical protein
VDLSASKRPGVLDRLADVFLELPGLGRFAGHAPVSRGEVAGRHVEQDHLQLVLVELLPDLRGLKFVGKQELDPAETGPRGGAEALQKGYFIEHHGEVGVELRHESSRDYSWNGLSGAAIIAARRTGARARL